MRRSLITFFVHFLPQPVRALHPYLPVGCRTISLVLFRFLMPSITRNTIYSADYSPTALAKFKEEINKANLSDLVQPALMSDPNISYNNLDQVLLKAKALHIPIKQVKFDKKETQKESLDNDRYN